MASDALDEIDAISSLAQGATVVQHGRIRHIDLLGPKAVKAVFRREDIIPLRITPGFGQRTPVFHVNYRWSEVEDRYQSRVEEVHGPSLDALGTRALDAPTDAPDIISRWIDNEDLAKRFANDVVTTQGAGRIVWVFRTTYPYPELQHGDLLAVESDWFVARDPNSARQLRGRLFGLGVITGRDALGYEFEIWIRNFGDILASAEAVLRPNVDPDTDVIVYSTASEVDFTPTGAIVFDAELRDLHNEHDLVTDSDRITLVRPGLRVVGGKFHAVGFTGTGEVRIVKNGTTTLASRGWALGGWVSQQAAAFDLAARAANFEAGDYLQVFVEQSAGSITVLGGNPLLTSLQVSRPLGETGTGILSLSLVGA